MEIKNFKELPHIECSYIHKYLTIDKLLNRKGY